MNMKPYQVYDSIDLSYLIISNKIFSEIKTFTYLFNEFNLSIDQAKQMAVFLTSYLEDLVSNTNIWNTFVDINLKKYKKPIPFYIEKNYNKCEINYIDVKFLIWYYLNMSMKQRFLSPFDDYLDSIANVMFTILDDEYEFVIENSKIKESYELKEDADYYETRKVVQTYLFENYLLSIDAKQALLLQIEEVVSNNKDKLILQERLINSLTDELTSSFRTYLFAYKGKDWVSEIIGKKHPLHTSINSLSNKIKGYFFYKETNKDSFIFQHIATDKLFSVNKDSYNAPINNNLETIYYLEIIEWNKEWVFSGITFQQTFNANLILDEKNSIEARKSVSYSNEKEVNKIKKILDKQLFYFMKYFDSQIVFTNSQKIEKEINSFINLYNLSISDTNNVVEAKNRQTKKGFFGIENNLNTITSKDNIVLFFNPNSGMEIYPDIASIFPDSNNLYYSKENVNEIKMFLFSNEFSTEITTFFIDNYASKLDFFLKGTGKKYLKDIDFLMRFWKNNNYVSKSNLTII